MKNGSPFDLSSSSFTEVMRPTRFLLKGSENVPQVS